VFRADPSGQSQVALGTASRLSGNSPLGDDRTQRHSELSLVARIARFVAVGGTCYFIQLGFLHSLESLMALYIADVLAFMISAQVNFALSLLFTWADRIGAERLSMRWLKFNLNALLSVTVVNAAIFWVLVSVGLPFWGAMLLANTATACCTFVVNHILVFKGEQVNKPNPRNS
jgi:putative flippase GtrA